MNYDINLAVTRGPEAGLNADALIVSGVPTGALSRSFRSETQASSKLSNRRGYTVVWDGAVRGYLAATSHVHDI